MTSDPRSDVINRQYEAWSYPEPITDIPGWLEGNWERFDPSHAHPILWPDRGYQSGMDILIAGCGTNQAAVFAYTNPDAKVVGVDISQASLDHQQFLKDKYGLDNLELHLLPIEELPALGREFDLVVSTGVLMVMADPQAGMNALAKCVRPDGVVATMVYAKYGRFAVTLLQSAFRDLGLGLDDESVRVVRAAMTQLAPDHPIRSYLHIAPDLQTDAGLVDTFLIGRESTYSADECIELTERAGLVFQTWLMNAPYYPHAHLAPNEFSIAVGALPPAKQWSVMDRFRAANGCHFVVACRPGRPKESYAISFSTPDALSYVPVFRHRCGLEGVEIYRPDWRVALTPEGAELVRRVNGVLSIREILEQSAGDGEEHPVQTEDGALKFFEGLWQYDFLAMTCTPSARDERRKPKVNGSGKRRPRR
ncbi:MAG: class I SAM-dependent methyltransferase [Mycobacterium sp.]|nr:class I SAM-dependent methyltransferase [Mycobacterium sp.]